MDRSSSRAGGAYCNVPDCKRITNPIYTDCIPSFQERARIRAAGMSTRVGRVFIVGPSRSVASMEYYGRAGLARRASIEYYGMSHAGRSVLRGRLGPQPCQLGVLQTCRMGSAAGQAIPLREQVGCRRLCRRQRAIADAELEGDDTPVAFRSGSMSYAPGDLACLL